MPKNQPNYRWRTVRNQGSAGDPDEPGTEGFELVLAPLDGEQVVDKSVSDSFASGELGPRLRELGVDGVVAAAEITFG